MLNITKGTLTVLILLLLLISPTTIKANANVLNFLPFEDNEHGRNSNAYLSIYGTPSDELKQNFVDEITIHAKDASENWGIPASVIIGMAIIESGYGSTRIALNANNIFGIKTWGYNPSNAWQLKGQPNEDFDNTIPVIANYGTDRIVYDETKRRDNWYRMFDSYEETINYLAGNLLLNNRYGFARENYAERMKYGWSIEKATKQYLFEIAEAGYNHLGGDYYRNLVGNKMEQWNLFRHDRRGFKDTIGSWAEKEIIFLSEKGWINGYSDGTFKPNDNLTRAQAATIMNNSLSLVPTNEEINFEDVHSSFWALKAINTVAQHGIMNGIKSGVFSPNTNITRAQMAQILYNARMYGEDVNPKTSRFTDVRNDHWAYKAIQTMKEEGIMVGFSDGSFRPNEPITRIQMVVTIYRVNQLNF